MHTKQKGDIGELVAAQEFLRQGWHVAFPYGENMKYDLIVEKEGIFKRVQVKSVYPRNGVLHVNCRSSNNWSVTSYTSNDIDLLAAVDLQSNKVYFIPSNKINKALFDLRLEPAKNGQKKNINFVGGYLEIQ